MMYTLNDKPGSSTRRQRQTLVIEGRRHGLELNELRRMVGGSISGLSVASASSWIKRFTGNDLPNAPGHKPPVYDRTPTPGARRIISRDLCEQIDRLSVEYFYGDCEAAAAWLEKNFGVCDPYDLATQERGGHVVYVLKGMHERRAESIR